MLYNSTKLLALLAIAMTVAEKCANAQEVKDTKTILANVTQNYKKLSNFKIRCTRLRVDANAKGRMEDSSISRELFILSESGTFAEIEDVKVLTSDTLTRKIRYWRSQGALTTAVSVDKEQYVDEDEQKRDLITAAYENSRMPIPLSSLEKLQLPTGLGSSDLMFYLENSKYDGGLDYKGLKCIKMTWGDTKSSPGSGYVLICPERDWKVLYIEAYEPGENTGKGNLVMYATRVENLVKVQDSWVPFTVQDEKITISGDKREIVSQQKVQVLELEPDFVNSESIFQPIFSPGTRLYSSEEGNEFDSSRIVGGDIREIILQFQKLDFSAINYEDKKSLK